MKRIAMLILIFGAVALPASDPTGGLDDQAADADNTPLTSCEPEAMAKLNILLLSWDEEASICKIIRNSIGRSPSVRLSRALCKAIIGMQLNGNKDKPKDIAYQLMNIIEARGQEKNDKSIYSTFETVMKIFIGSEGDVTPKDLNINLRSAGPIAKTLSDDGLMSMAALIQEDKKSRGE
jgi:hypothetical protein